jgi:hypothetical protein
MLLEPQTLSYEVGEVKRRKGPASDARHSEAGN